MDFCLKIWHLVAPVLRSSTSRFYLRTKVNQKSGTKIMYFWQGVHTHPTHFVCLHH